MLVRYWLRLVAHRVGYLALLVRISDGFASLSRISVRLHLHDLPFMNGRDIGNVALSRLTTALRPGLEMEEHRNLVSNDQNLFRDILHLLARGIREREVIDDRLSSPIGATSVELFGFDPERVRVYGNGIDCPLTIASTAGFIRIPEPVNAVLAHL